MPDSPNILLFMTDQQRWDTIGALGNKHIQTPALDSIAHEGTSFDSAYCPSPVCMASRASLLLGEYPYNTGCVSNMPMPQERTSLMEILNDAGYQTHGVGKMHFGPDRHKLWGFEDRDYNEEGGMSEDNDYSQFLWEHGYDHIIDPCGMRSEYYYVPQPSQLPAELHTTQWSGDRALDFLKQRDTDRPFFLWDSYIKPHPPFESPVPWSRLYRALEMPFPFQPRGSDDFKTFWNHVQNRYKYRDQGFDGNLVRLIRAAYYSAISFVDYQVGRILEYLREQGELDNTLVIYLSDHGELLGDYGCWGKRSMLDPASRVPMLIRYPGRFEQGKICQTPVSHIDVVPTCLAAAGLETLGQHQGLDMAQMAEGNCDRDGVICQFQQDGTGLYALVTDEFKYAYSAPDDKEWLFYRGNGQREQRNVAGNPAFTAELNGMRQRLIEMFKDGGYERPLEGDDWKTFPKQEIPSTPDAGQLFQDGRDVSDEFPEGYEPRVKPSGGLPFKGI